MSWLNISDSSLAKMLLNWVDDYFGGAWQLAEQVKKIIDFKDSLSTISLLKVSQVFGKMVPMEILEIRGADSEIREDLFKVLPQDAYEIVEVADPDISNDTGRLRIRKCR